SSTSSRSKTLPVIGATKSDSPAAAVSPSINFSGLSSLYISFPYKSSGANFFWPKITVKINGTTIAIAIAMANLSQNPGLIDKIPGSPPTPIDDAITPVDTENRAAKADPAIAEKNGKEYFRLTPNIAGSVTPR